MTEETKMMIEEQVTESIINAARNESESTLLRMREECEQSAEEFVSSLSGSKESLEEYKKLFIYSYEEYLKENM